MEQPSVLGFPLSPLQKAIWTGQAVAPTSSFCRVLVEGSLDLERLRAACLRIVQRHESLRTVFRQPPGYSLPFQVIQGSAELGWEYLDLAGDVPGVQERQLAISMFESGWPEISLADGPTLAIRVFKTGLSTHVLVVRVFALCTDALSFQNVVAELAAEYEGTGSEEEPVQYADFSQWHEEQLSSGGSEESEEAKQFWSEPRIPLRLPFDARIPGTGLPGRGSYAFQIANASLPGVESKDVGLFLFACWQALLWRLTNQESIVVSYIGDGRWSEELRSSIGLFSQPLPVLCNITDHLSFGELRTRLAESVTLSQRWQYHCPTAVWGAPGEGIGFQFSQSFQAQIGDGPQFSIISCSPHRWPFKTSLFCQAVDDSIRFELLYDATVLSADDMARVAKYFERTVRAAVEDFNSSLIKFDLLDSVERGDILQACNSARALAEDTIDEDKRCLHEMFETQAALTPDRVALIFEQTELTYAQLNSRANQLAHWLRASGVGPNVKVGLCLERSAEAIVALLGILKSGGAYVPLLPDLPVARLAHQLAETEAPVLITVEALSGRVPEFAGRVLCLDRQGEELEKQPILNPAHTVTPKDLIYVLYTSGSTGTPKGVAVRHGNVTNYTNGICRVLGLRESTKDPGLTFATVSTLGADLGNTVIFPSLVTGGSLCVIPYEAAADAQLFAQRMREHPIDVLKITPSNMNALMISGDPKSVLPRRHLIVGGEACSWDLVHRVYEAGGCTVTNHYGPTEATIGCLAYAVAKTDDPSEAIAATVPLGRPIGNTQVYVLDSERRPVPAGVAGEIYVSGDGVSDGYIGQPEETRQRFLPHPFLAGGSPLYRTGDRGRFLADRSIEFLGRVDNQVKIRGYRVELAEIESVLSAHEAIQQAVVVLSRSDAGERLAAYIVAAPAPSQADLKNYLRERLPEYMIPSSFTVVAQFPLNRNGKIDRQALAEERISTTARNDRDAAPRNEVEERLVAIWKEVLSLEEVGIRDNFFERGGHSLLAMVMVSRIRAAFEVQITIRTLFEAPTIESLAVAIGMAESENSEELEMIDLLSELEGLSGEEAKQLLGNQGEAWGHPAPARRD